jgi:hypothetical protein
LAGLACEPITVEEGQEVKKEWFDMTYSANGAAGKPEELITVAKPEVFRV